MGDNETYGNCPAHTGQEERIKSAFSKVNLLIWMIGLMIVILTTVGGVLYSSIQAVQISLAGYSPRLTTIEEKLRAFEVNDQRITDRLDRMDQKK